MAGPGQELDDTGQKDQHVGEFNFSFELYFTLSTSFLNFVVG